MDKPPVYRGWRIVPDHLWSKTQLADNDLPRMPGGPVRGWVETSDWRGKPDTVALYDARESTPTAATARQLDAARRRSSTGDDTRCCGVCGARCERPLPAPARPAPLRCPACAHIARLAAAQIKARADRVAAIDWARQLRSDATVALVRVQQVLRPAAPSGRRNPNPIALRVDAVDADGGRLLEVTVRTAGAKVRAMPADAVDPADVVDELRALLLARTVITWRRGATDPLWQYALDRSARPFLGGHEPDRYMADRVAAWRGEVDPYTAALRQPLPPGRADRMWLLLDRMARTATAPSAPTKIHEGLSA